MIPVKVGTRGSCVRQMLSSGPADPQTGDILEMSLPVSSRADRPDLSSPARSAAGRVKQTARSGIRSSAVKFITLIMGSATHHTRVLPGASLASAFLLDDIIHAHAATMTTLRRASLSAP